MLVRTQRQLSRCSWRPLGVLAAATAGSPATPSCCTTKSANGTGRGIASHPSRKFSGNSGSDIATTTGSSSIDKAAPPSMLKRVWRSLTSDNDDHSSEYKIQERKDYYLLLVTKLRQVRLENPDLEYMQAFDKAFEELEKRALDDMSNVQLRYEMQDALAPFVLDAFEAFDTVDSTMAPELFGLVESTTNTNTDPAAAAGEDTDVMANHNYGVYKDVLKDEWEQTSTRLEEFRSSPDLRSPDAISLKLSRSIAFLERKLGALKLVIDFHGWDNSDNSSNGKGQWVETIPTDFDDELDDFGFRVTTADEATFIAIRQYQTINLYRAALLRKELGYSVLALKSLIPGAGRGVFVDGTALAGSLVAFQPGPVWPLGSVRPDVEDHFNDNDNLQLSIRYDNFIVDSRRSPYTVLTRPNSNPFAIGHVVNHPQPGSLPNLSSVMLNFTQNMALQDLHRYVPNHYAVPPAWINRTFDRYVIDMHSMCLLARRDVQEEEMHYDYRLIGAGLPSWYHKIIYPEE